MKKVKRSRSLPPSMGVINLNRDMFKIKNFPKNPTEALERLENFSKKKGY